MARDFQVKDDNFNVTISYPWSSSTVPSPAEKSQIPLPSALAASIWNVSLDKATQYCVMYWSDKIPGCSLYIDNLYEMTVQAASLTWQDVAQSIRRAVERIPGLELTFTKTNDKALEYFRLYRAETMNRGGDWNIPFLRDPSASPQTIQLERIPLQTDIWNTLEIPHDSTCTELFDKISQIGHTVSLPPDETDFTMTLKSLLHLSDRSLAHSVSSVVTKAGFTFEHVKSMVLTHESKKRKACEITPPGPVRICALHRSPRGCSHGSKCPLAHVTANQERPSPNTPNTSPRVVTKPVAEVLPQQSMNTVAKPLAAIPRKLPHANMRHVCWLNTYSREGCNQGDSCPDLHVASVNLVCQHFQMERGCRKGDSCRLIHAILAKRR